MATGPSGARYLGQGGQGLLLRSGDECMKVFYGPCSENAAREAWVLHQELYACATQDRRIRIPTPLGIERVKIAPAHLGQLGRVGWVCRNLACGYLVCLDDVLGERWGIRQEFIKGTPLYKRMISSKADIAQLGELHAGLFDAGYADLDHYWAKNYIATKERGIYLVDLGQIIRLAPDQRRMRGLWCRPEDEGWLPPLTRFGHWRRILSTVPHAL
jgi:hypothetical protein